MSGVTEFTLDTMYYTGKYGVLNNSTIMLLYPIIIHSNLDITVYAPSVKFLQSGVQNPPGNNDIVYEYKFIKAVNDEVIYKMIDLGGGVSYVHLIKQ